jgi:hypothetical protein
LCFAGYFGSTLRDIAETVGSYKSHRAVTVWYDPRNPRRAVLNPGISFENILFIAGGLSVFAVGLVLLHA